MGWTRSGPPAKPWPATTPPAHASAAIARRSGSCTPPAPASWPPGGRPPPAQGPDRHRPRPAARPSAGAALAPAARCLCRAGRRPGDPLEHRATVRALALTAQRALAARADAKQLEAELRQLVMAVAPALLGQPGSAPSAPPSCCSAGPIPAGSALRLPLPCWRGGPGSGVLGPGRPPSPPPGWRSAAESGLAHHRDVAPGPSRADQGLHQPPHRPGQEPTRDPPLPQAHGRSPAVPSPGAASPDPGHGVTASRVSAEATLSTGGGRDPVDTPTTRGGRRPRRRRRQRPALPGRAVGSWLRGAAPGRCIPAPRQPCPAR
jgi:hypothetical protein